jgi:hypothetical protein
LEIAMRAALLFLMWVSQTLAGTLSAQQSVSGLAGNAMGVSMDRFMYDGSSLVAMSYRFSTLRPRQVGAEIGVSLFPQYLAGGILALAPDFGAAYNFPVPGGSFLLKAGGSALAALSTSGTRFVPGFHLGGTVVVQTGARSGLRIDLIRHYYLPGEGGIQPIWSAGLGFAIIPRVRA